MYDLDSILGSNGDLVKHIEGFQSREGQLSMAQAIERAINQRTHLVAEAGTGTGKTFAYLIPAILSGKKTIISTGTRNLQDQIFEKDFPLIRDILKRPVEVQSSRGEQTTFVCIVSIKQKCKHRA